ncbi:hypothetical protein V6N13_058233 [Hibiscus sabdariffa]|uniref:Uncharacterized protein n=1 Tax=Hibiscus sabdariffa TaxID=183260 RepID=A0ABR2GGS1_9ROSI
MAISEGNGMKVVEDVSYVSPSPGSVPTSTLPLSCFDKYFLCFSDDWMQRLFFYEFQYPTSHFKETALPKLRASLSLTLQLFFPFAGKLVFPPPPQMPYVLYTEGDSVAFVAYESSADFNHLVGDHSRSNQDFHALVPKSPPAIASSRSNGCMQRPTMAVQVTMFPNVGISIGVGFSHVAADGRTLAHFMKSWASLHRCQGDLTCLDNYLPSFNRDSINDPLRLAPGLFTMHGRIFQEASSSSSSSSSSSTSNVSVNNIRVTCKINRPQVELLKDWVNKKCMEVKPSEPMRISTFVVTCAYMWVCLIKLQQAETHQHPNLLSYFHFGADCREHLKLPATYFGNCIISCLATAEKSELLGPRGILVAATAIGREILKFQEKPFKDVKESLPKIIETIERGNDIIFASASPKFGVYETDFGWGRPKKTEAVSMSSLGSLYMFSTAESNEEEGGVEFGLPLAPIQLDCFNAVFQGGLQNLL